VSAATYIRYELRRIIRNRRVIIFTLAFPVILACLTTRSWFG
jgi:hypothetical protein